MIVRENLPHELDERANAHFVQNYLEFKKHLFLGVHNLYSYAIESCKDMCCTVLPPDISSPGIEYKDFAGYRFRVFPLSLDASKEQLSPQMTRSYIISTEFPTLNRQLEN